MTSPSRRTRIAVALALGLGAACYSLSISMRETRAVPDVDLIWWAARALWSGSDPYRGVVGHFPYPLFYPLPAVLVGLPLAALPLTLARAAFSGVGAGALTYALTRDGWTRMPLFLGVPFVQAVELGQWAPLLTAGLLCPALAWLFPCKPNLGAALFAGRPSWSAAIGGVLLVVLSLAVQPGWPAAWLGALTASHGTTTPLVLYPGGALLLLAALRWRRPEARLLLALACVPTTGGLYDALPLFLIPASAGASVALALLSHGAAALITATLPVSGTFADFAAVSKRVTLACLYIPALGMVLRRPNVAPERAGLVSAFPTRNAA